MDAFVQRKKVVLSKLDKSRKGSIDKNIEKICNIINSKENYFTTSSCSGRILVIKIDEENRKNNSEWLFTSHELVEYVDKLIKCCNEDDLSLKGNVWFKQEPMILHVCCNDVDSACNLWDVAQKIGYKRGGVRKGRHWYNVEIMGSEFIEAPLKEVDEVYIKVLVAEGNKRMKRSFFRMKEFEKKLAEL